MLTGHFRNQLKCVFCWGLLLFGVIPFDSRPLLACKCAGSSSVCAASTSSDVVFIGRVDSIQPNIDPWDGSYGKRFRERFPEEELDKLETDSSPETLRKIKDVYSDILPEPYKSRIAHTSNRAELDAVMEALMDEGKRVLFQVIEVFQGSKQETIQLWTGFSNCGPYFQKGETYVVYANRRDNDRLEAGACSRTRRLTDAGEDLAYLHFIQHGGTAASRVFGFVTSSELDLRTPRLWDSVSSPLSDLIVELQTEAGTRHASTDRQGRFVFDGLKPGDCLLSIFDRDYPEEMRLLAGPRQVNVTARSCSAELF